MARTVSIANRFPRLKIERRSLLRAIAVLDESFDFVPADRPHLSPAARARSRPKTTAFSRKTDPASVAPNGELSLVFLSDRALAEIHARFLDDPTVTDVITFEGNEELESAGEICVSVETASRYAREHRRAFAEELTLYVVHGWLHLAGYDDLQPAKKRRMRAAESRALDLLRKENALPGFALR